MPTYDYRCKACGHAFEEFQSMSAPHLKKCPSCGKPALERLIGTGAALIFKGGGFYETDYRSDSYKKAAQADTKPADSKPQDAAKPAADTQSAAKSDSTPAPSSPAKPAKPEKKSKGEKGGK